MSQAICEFLTRISNRTTRSDAVQRVTRIDPAKARRLPSHARRSADRAVRPGASRSDREAIRHERDGAPNRDTHGWIHQVIARNTKNEIVSAYDPEDVARTVRLSIGLALAASAGIAMNVNDTEYTELENKLKALYQNIYGIAL